MSDAREASWGRIVVTGLAALGVAAVVIGIVAGLVAFGATRVAGLGDSAGTSAPETLYLPPYTQTPIEAPTHHLPSVKPTPRPSATSTSPAPSPTATEVSGEITLEASPAQATAGSRVTLSGAYPEGGGELQVQRLEASAWIDFPVKASVKPDGSFSTTISTSRQGEHRFRVFDAASGRSSNSVVVTIG